MAVTITGDGCKFRPMLSTSGFYQLGLFYVPHLLQHKTSGHIQKTCGFTSKCHTVKLSFSREGEHKEEKFFKHSIAVKS
jgi:hypothetical protein